jgi:hypothetical protein
MSKGRDMNLAHYNLNDLYRLFHLSEKDRLESVGTQLHLAKKLMAQTHPDKSKLPDCYFQFFQSAYKKLSTILNSGPGNGLATDIPGLSTDIPGNGLSTDIPGNGLSTDIPGNGLATEDAKQLTETLDNYFQYRPELLDPKVLNKWLNEKFEQYVPIQPIKGHGDWLSSDANPEHSGEWFGKHFVVNCREDIHRNFELLHQNQAQQQLVEVKVQAWDACASSSLGGDYLGDPDELYEQGFGSGQGKYFDIREAYESSCLPIGNLDTITSIPGISSLQKQREQEYKSWKPISKEEAENVFLEEQRKEQEKERERRWYQTTQLDLFQEKTNAFHGELHHLTYEEKKD